MVMSLAVLLEDMFFSWKRDDLKVTQEYMQCLFWRTTRLQIHLRVPLHRYSHR